MTLTQCGEVGSVPSPLEAYTQGPERGDKLDIQITSTNVTTSTTITTTATTITITTTDDNNDNNNNNNTQN